MISYIGRHAELYDIMYSTKPYKEESCFINDYFRTYNQSGNTLLELACGTGNHALEFEEQKFTITAFDNSEDMIRQALIKKNNRNSRTEFLIDSMIDFKTIGSRQFHFSVCLFDSLGYVLTNNNIITALKNVYNSLEHKGIFCCEVWHSAAMLKNFSPSRKREWVLPDRTIIRFSETELNLLESSATIDFTIVELMNDNTVQKINEKQKNRFFSYQEIMFFLQAAGFSTINIFDGYTNNAEINDNTWHLLCFAHKE